MHYLSTIAFAWITSALPSASAATVPLPNEPVLSFSKAFQLVAHVTNKSLDLTPSVERWFVYPSYFENHHVRRWTARLNPHTYIDKTDPYFAVGSQEEYALGMSNISTQMQIGTRHFDLLFAIDDPYDSNKRGVEYLTPGCLCEQQIALSGLLDPTSHAVPKDQFLACVGYSTNMVRHIGLYNLDTSTNATIPTDCVPVRIYPECLPSDEVRDEYKAKVDEAPVVRCYQPGADYSVFDDLPTL
ncbi:hypothetical protein VHEMI06137 [[Torrubiella] hemipterigena]|uniref:Uncharacterized protein n=1 Tax=[Torrubiella] hemipterigena TaxID=1531966 RepID=A0A0A1SZT3_9HYPO|nr:hypothetical protein VHEMI06137 [[Torrubiella] hemipterigena]